MSHPSEGEHRLNISTQSIGGAVVLQPVGTVDLFTSPNLRKLLLRLVRTDSKIVIDLSGVSYMDSSGLATVVEAYQTLMSKDGKLRLAAAREEVTFVIQLARLDKIFKIDATVEDSLRHLGVKVQ